MDMLSAIVVVSMFMSVILLIAAIVKTVLDHRD